MISEESCLGYRIPLQYAQDVLDMDIRNWSFDGARRTWLCGIRMQRGRMCVGRRADVVGEKSID